MHNKEDAKTDLIKTVKEKNILIDIIK